MFIQDGTTFTAAGKSFNKIIVDVECTHEGSLKHIVKFLCPPVAAQAKEAKEKDLSHLSNRERKRRLNLIEESRQVKNEYMSSYDKSNMG